MMLEFLPMITSVLDRIIPDKAAADDAKLKVLQLAQTGDLAELDASVRLALGQVDINKAEASSGNKFASSWRPLVGYVCATGLGIQFIVAPIATWIAALAGHPVVFPALDMGTLMTLLVGMLGLSGMRTTEKLNGKA